MRANAPPWPAQGRPRIRFAWLLLILSLLVPRVGAAGAQAGGLASPSAGVSQSAPTAPRAPSSSLPPGAGYSLNPEQRAKAVAYSRSQYALYFLGTLASLLIYLFLWSAGASQLFRDWARRASRHHSLQGLIFVPLFWVAADLLSFPLDYYGGFVLEHRFGLSTRGFASWLADWAKSLGVATAVATLGAGLFYALVRQSPRRWWVYGWLASIPLVLAFIFVEPLVLEPLFSRFTPLAATQPALVGRIEAMLDHAGLTIPPNRVFEMDASSKTRTVDAYVSGLGASKRVVVWDTTVGAMGTDELLMVLGHETGHYVLHHIPKEFAADEAVALVFSFLGFLALTRLVDGAGLRSDRGGVEDLALFPWVLIVFTLLTFLSSPIVNAISRRFEHQADQFGLEVAYGVVADPNAAEVQSLQILGEQDLADPDPGPFIKFWLYTHPPLRERIRFAASYKPWAEGKSPELLPNRR